MASLEERVAQLEATVANLNDHIAIRQVIARARAGNPPRA